MSDAGVQAGDRHYERLVRCDHQPESCVRYGDGDGTPCESTVYGGVHCCLAAGHEPPCVMAPTDWHRQRLAVRRWLAVAGPSEYVMLLECDSVGPDVFVKLADYERLVDENRRLHERLAGR